MTQQILVPQLPAALAPSANDLYAVSQNGKLRKQTMTGLMGAQDNMRPEVVQALLTATSANEARVALGLGNLDNTADLDKPVSTAQQTALNLKADKAATEAKTNHFLTNESEGIPVGGVIPSSAALILAEQKAYDTGAILELSGTYLLDSDVEFRRPFRTNGTVKFLALAAGDVVPTKNIRFSRRFSITGVTFEYLNVMLAPATGSQLSSMAEVTRNVFINSPLFVGQEKVSTEGYEIARNDHVWRLSRQADAITLTNTSLVSIGFNRMQSFRRGVNIVTTRSYGSDGISLLRNEMTNCLEGVRALGNSMCRTTGLNLDGNLISGSAKDATNISQGAVVVTWAFGLTMRRNVITSNSDIVKIQACNDTIIEFNYLDSAGIQGACLRASGCSGGKLQWNSLRSASGYLALIGAASLNSITTGNVYASRNWTITDNEGLCASLGIFFADTDGCDAQRNKITSSTAATNGLIRYSSTCTRGRHYANELRAPSGVGVKNDAGAEVVGTVSTDDLIITTTPASVVNAPIITAVDADLDNAKSYLTTFTLGHYSQLRQLASDTAPMTLSGWMGTVTGETLGWNSAAWDTSNNRLGDIVVNGITMDNFDVESWWWARSCVMIDRQNRLTCRNWATTEAETPNVPVGVSARQIAEQAWQTASFRPPLVVDGAIYDPVPSGLTTATDYSVTRSGRTALGQKLDGTYVLLTVDGQTGVSGTTSAKVAAKMLAAGCQNAFMLDGGGSTTLWYMGAVINSPSDAGGERIIPACMYV